MSTALRNGALVTEVRDRLAAAFEAGENPPSQRDLAAELDVSRHAVREALKALAPSPPTAPTVPPSPPAQSPISPTGRPPLTQDPPTVAQPYPLGDAGHPDLTHPSSPPAQKPPSLTQLTRPGETGRPPVTHPHPADDQLGDTGRTAGDPPPHTTAPGGTRVARWPLLLLALPAFVAVWGGWVGLGDMVGFGMIQPLPGIWGQEINTAITLPIGLETYAAYALHVALSGQAPTRPARLFALWSAAGSLLLAASGQIAYHTMAAAGLTVAPWGVTAAVAVLPVAVLGMGAALAHLIHPASPSRPAAVTQPTQPHPVGDDG